MSHFGSLFIFSRALEDRTTLFTECYDEAIWRRIKSPQSWWWFIKEGHWPWSRWKRLPFSQWKALASITSKAQVAGGISCVLKSLWPMAKFATKYEHFWIQRQNFLIQFLWRFPTLSARLKMVSEIADSSHHTKKHWKCLKFFRHYLKKDKVFTLIITPTTLLPLASSLRSQNRI